MSEPRQPTLAELPLAQARRVDQACDRFEADLKAGRRPAIEDFLGEVAETERPALLGELVAVEVAYRRRAGDEPRVLGKFQLLERVGAGAFGVVWRARDAELGRTVALKVPHAGLLEAPEHRERFAREARAAAQLRHPGIVTVYDVVTLDGAPALVSEFVDGRSLRDVLKDRRPGFRAAAALVVEVAEALDYAHGMGVVHRDVKPANILLPLSRRSANGADGMSCGTAPTAPDSIPPAPFAERRLNEVGTKLVDFGLALREEDATLTHEGQLIGTPAYMSPEQAAGKGHAVDRRSDVYSLGVVLYELLTGEVPFRGPRDSVLRQVLDSEPRPPRRLRLSVPRDLETICLKALAKEPGRRYATARELADDLRRWLNNEPIRARAAGVAERVWRWARRRPAAAALIGVSGVAVLAVGGVIASLFYSSRLEQEVQRTETFRYFHHIAVAHAKWEKAYLGQTLALLEACPTDRRGWEWHYLQRICHADLFTLRGHEGAVNGIAFSPDGTRLLSGGHDRTLRIWDAATGRLLHTVKAHSHHANAVAFSPLGAQFASASPDGSVKLWDVGGGSPTHLEGHTAWAQCVAFSPDGTRLAAGGVEGTDKRETDREGTVRVWTLSDPGQPLILRGHRKLVIGIAFSPDGRQLASASVDGTVILWDVPTGRQKLPPLKGHKGWVWGVAFSPDGKRLVSAGQDLRIWDPVTGQQLHKIEEGHTAGVTCVAYSPDGSRLVSCSRDMTVRVWDATTGKPLSTLRGHTGWVVRLAFSPDGSRLASASSDGTVKVWSVLTEAECRTLKGHTQPVSVVAFGPDNSRLASVAGDNTVRVWDMTTGRVVRTLAHQVAAPIPSVAYSPDGTRLAAPHKDKTVIVWDAQTGEELFKLPGHDQSVWTLAFSPDSAWLASSDVDGQVKLWDMRTGPEIRTLRALLREDRMDPPNMGGPGVAFSRNGTALAMAGMDGSLHVWNPRTGENIFAVQEAHERNTRCVAFSPDGSRLASGGLDMSIRIWDARTGRLEHELRGYAGPVNNLAYSPDGSRLVTVGSDQTLRIWDVATWQELLVLQGNRGLAFSPDGSRLVSTAYGNTIKIWDARSMTPELRVEHEAVSVLDFLLAGPLDRVAVREHLNKTQTISPAVGQKALDLLENYPEETWQSGRKQPCSARYLRSGKTLVQYCALLAASA